MKFTWMFCFLFSFLSTVIPADSMAREELSIVKSIDDLDLPPASTEATDEALPFEEIENLLEAKNYTVLSPSRVRELFTTLKKDPNARNRVAGGKCSIRRSYIQRHLRKQNISSGQLYLQCPSNNGRMRLIDQVTGHRYTFSNFHDVNLVAVPNGYHVMDVQFTSEPMTLSGYLAHVEASQKLKPLKNRTSGDRGYCYWSIR